MLLTYADDPAVLAAVGVGAGPALLRDAGVVHRRRPGRLVLQVLRGSPRPAAPPPPVTSTPSSSPTITATSATAPPPPAIRPRRHAAAAAAAAEVLDLRGVELGVVAEVRHRRRGISRARRGRARATSGSGSAVEPQADPLGVRVVGAAAPVDEPEVERRGRQRARGASSPARRATSSRSPMPKTRLAAITVGSRGSPSRCSAAARTSASPSAPGGQQELVALARARGPGSARRSNARSKRRSGVHDGSPASAAACPPPRAAQAR